MHMSDQSAQPPLILKPVLEPLRHSKLFWGGVVAALGGVLTVFGVVYLAGGRQVLAIQDAYAVLIRYVPGGMRTYGGVMLLLAASLLHGLLPVTYRQPMLLGWLHRTLYVVAGFAFLAVWGFTWSWILTGFPTWQAITYWTAIMVVALLAGRYPPVLASGGRGRAS